MVWDHLWDGAGAVMTKITSTKAIEAATRPGRYALGDGLYLYVSKTGRKTWVLRYQRNRQRRDAGLGAYPAVGLSEARQAAFAAQRQLAQGLDPILQRKLAKQSQQPLPTFS